MLLTHAKKSDVMLTSSSDCDLGTFSESEILTATQLIEGNLVNGFNFSDSLVFD